MDHYGETPKSHNFGPKCRLAPVAQPSQVDDIPPIKAQYFYNSPIPIDDPLSTSAVATTTDSKALRGSLRPFSPGDNNALERAWLSLSSAQYRRNHTQARRNRSPSPSLAGANAEKLRIIIHDLAVRHAEKHACEGPSREPMQPALDTSPTPETGMPLCCPDLLSDVGITLRTSFCALARRRQQVLHRERVAQDIMAEMETLRVDSTATATTQHRRSGSVSSDQQRTESSKRLSHLSSTSNSRPSSRRAYPSEAQDPREIRVRPRSSLTACGASVETNADVSVPIKSSLVDDGISGKPFVRVDAPDSAPFSPPSSLAKVPTPNPVSGPTGALSNEKSQNEILEPHRPSPPPGREKEPRQISVEVTVGVSRLHEVSLPALQMKPIYW